MKDCQLTVHMIADGLQINLVSVRHYLTDFQKQSCLGTSQDFVETAYATPNFSNCTVTKDEF